ncbi:hypothetical protein [Chondromyces crocatus]|uniref:Uncharacterized protein n=1 Tax=Chondromyces crocatus TaxID=52 RepID=A0A0K1E5X9_CHOCO|nr:hypothetical protein [Chondromyces crocatus]AKT36254.1 uncharacterized protein CMC5_003680 [Chondromyces crocatus]
MSVVGSAFLEVVRRDGLGPARGGVALVGLLGGLALLGASGCGAFANGYKQAAPMVRERASYELDCPDQEVRLEEELGGWFKAVGCGRKARYRAACDGLRCVVSGENETAIPWRDRPPPGDVVTR